MQSNNNPVGHPAHDEQHGQRRITAQEQMWAMLNTAQQEALRPILRCLKKMDQECLSYGVIAYLKFGIRRPFSNPFLQNTYMLMLTFCERYRSLGEVMRD